MSLLLFAIGLPNIEILSTATGWILLHSKAMTKPDVTSPIVPAPRTGVWQRFVLDTTLADANGGDVNVASTVSIDGTPVGKLTEPWPKPDVAGELCVGITYVKEWKSAMSFRYDDVLIETAP